MEQKTERLYASAPLGISGLEQRIQKKLNVVNSFKNSTNNLTEIIIYFKDKNNKSKKRYKKYKRLTTILKSFDTLNIIATTSSSITLSPTWIGSIAMPISTATACGLSFGNKVTYEIIKSKYKKWIKRPTNN